MKALIFIAVGGAVGAVLRYLTSVTVYAFMGRGFPYGTLFVNVSGSMLMGLLSVMMLERLDLGPEWRAAVLVGVLGSFTTFSTFSIETLNLLEQGEVVRATANIVLSVLLCLVAVWSGVLIGRQL
ncbi:MAG: fluoride efflux transporter CrcB [Thiotrichales bacterium]|nr:MAG: fluoride efflux transporter CrcB [Thiotrichales bacterium]